MKRALVLCLTLLAVVLARTTGPYQAQGSVAAGPTLPHLTGWGGIRMDEAAIGGGINQLGSYPTSAVFSGEHATNMELGVAQMKMLGYNSVRVDFDPYCTDTVDFNYMSIYSLQNAQRAIQIAQYFGFWIILDYHGYSDIFRDTSCWLSYWKPIVQNLTSLYSQIIWEPENEPEYVDCVNSPSSCPSSPCSTDSSCVAYLGTAYQQWIDQARSLGDSHWIVVQNLCSYSCMLTDMSQGYPGVNDAVGHVFISLHSYMDYSVYSSSWNNATAEILANQYYQAVLAGVSTTGWPALNTEGGANPISCASSGCPPDTVLNGSAGYTVVTFHFIQTLTSLYDGSSTVIDWFWWTAGSWSTDTPNATVYGSLQCSSGPVGWGCLLSRNPVIETGGGGGWAGGRTRVL